LIKRKQDGNISDEEMLHTFNCGVGFNLVVNERDKTKVIEHVSRYYDCYEIGKIRSGEPKVEYVNRIEWI
ncbi:MAG: phosphoribosylformylglycinamidine cyclo-ligase, partial [Clostridia bacterium]|nr:phosphoribosylformylglycinamidine cyclo-ligase [Clostridia bacterium]